MKLLKFALLATLLFNCSLLFFHDAWAAAVLTETPLGVLPGGTATVTWSGLAVTTPRDWIALYPAGGGPGSYRYYIYTSCLRTPGSTAPPAGTCPFPIPSVVPFGTYELRLLANDTETVLATSNKFNIGPVALRFVDNGDGTITDNQTGLMWEKKLNCADPNDDNRSVHCLNRQYSWTAGPGNNNDGTLFTNFLATLNAGLLGTSVDGITIVAPVCFAGHCDWRMPNINEMQTLKDCSSGVPCIDPIFAPMGTGPYGYVFHFWSSTSHSRLNSVFAWFYVPYNGGMEYDEKDYYYGALAVRGGQ